MKNIGTVAQLLPGQKGPGGFDMSSFIQNLPQKSVKDSDSILKDLIISEQDGVIKKIQKSNYAKLLKEYQTKGGKWTDE